MLSLLCYFLRHDSSRAFSFRAISLTAFSSESEESSRDKSVSIKELARDRF
jgi:hypothetical protein